MNLRRLLSIVLALLVIILFLLILYGNSTDSIEITPKENASIAVTGDVMFSRNMESVLSLDSSPFDGVSNVTSNVDLLLINFENPATTSENVVKNDIPFKCNPVYVPLARANNNTVAGLANNHAFDYGAEGMNDTFKYLKEANITAMGAGNSEDEAHQEVVKEINGRKITILNYMDADNFVEYADIMPPANGSSAGFSAYDSEDAYQKISENNDSDLIIAYLHFGNEYSTSPNDDQIRIAHELIDYGADVVIGSHPHVSQGIEMYKGKPIFYSLGNFIFDMTGDEISRAYFVQIDLVGDTGECTVYPVYNSNYIPQYMDADSGKELLTGLSPRAGEMNITDDGIGKLTFNLTDA